MNKKRRMDLFGSLSLILFSILMGLNQVLIKIVNLGIQPVFQAGLRSFLAIIPVLAFIFLIKKKINFKSITLLPGVLSGIIFGIEFMFLFIAIDYSTVARVSILFYSMPVFLAILAHFFIPDEKLTYLKIIGLLLALIGIFLILFLKQDSSQLSFFGDLFALLASLCWAIIAILNRSTSLRILSPEIQFLYQIIISSIILIPISFLFGDLLRDINMQIMLIFGFQILVIFSFGFIMWFWLLSIYSPSSMSSFSFLAPVFGVFFGWIILNEQITYFIFISLFLVCLGILFINIEVQNRR